MAIHEARATTSSANMSILVSLCKCCMRRQSPVRIVQGLIDTPQCDGRVGTGEWFAIKGKREQTPEPPGNMVIV